MIQVINSYYFRVVDLDGNLLIDWQKAMDLVEIVYQATKEF